MVLIRRYLDQAGDGNGVLLREMSEVEQWGYMLLRKFQDRLISPVRAQPEWPRPLRKALSIDRAEYLGIAVSMSQVALPWERRVTAIVHLSRCFKYVFHPGLDEVPGFHC